MNNCKLRVETQRSGPFTFQVGVDHEALALSLQRVADAHERFAASPLSQVASQLEREVVASSIFGTNSIEGGTLSEEETEEALQLDPAQVAEIEQRRVMNIKAAYDLARSAANRPGWRLDLDFIREIHAAVTRDLPHPHNRPGLFRDNPKNLITYVGDAAHGGRYKPPQYGADVQLLMLKLVEWHDALVADGVSPLIRAPLVHLYYELIHPFWDGNGRTARALFYWAMLHHGYWLFEFISISSILRKAPAKYARSFLYTETDDNDLTYFIVAQAKVIRQAIEGLHAYIQRKTSEVQEMEAHLRALDLFNHRQVDLIRHALKHPYQQYTVTSHRKSHNVVYQTARTDLLDLNKRAVLEKKKKGRQMVFFVPPDLTDRFLKMGQRIKS